MASRSEGTFLAGAAPGFAALFLTALLWGVGLIHVPPALGTGLLVGIGATVAVFCLWTRHWANVVVGLLCLAAITGFVVDTLVLERNVLVMGSRAEFGQAPPDRLRVLDFNVLHGYPHFLDQDKRAATTVAAIVALEPDVVILQEAWRTRFHGDFVDQLAGALGMDSAFARANGNLERIGFEEGEAILSRYPILQAIRMQLEPRRPFFERRVAILTVLDMGDDETLLIAGTHLDHRRLGTAAAQAQHLAGRLSGLPVTLIGADFNAPSGGPTLGALEGLGFTDLLPGGIDHVLLHDRSPWKVESANWTLRPDDVQRLLGSRSRISDHPGLLIELVRPRDAP